MSTATLQEWTTRTAFCAVSVIHLLPLVGVSGRRALEKAYGISVESPDLQLLLQHRAVLFGLLGTACLIAAFNAPSTNSAIARVVWADGVAIAALLIALLVHLFRTE